MLGWVKQGSVPAQIPCCCHFTCHPSSPYPTPARSTRTSAFLRDSAVACGFPTGYTPVRQQHGTAETDPQREAASTKDAAAPSRVFCRVVTLAWRRTDPHVSRREHVSCSPRAHLPVWLPPNPTCVLRGGTATGAEAVRVPATGRFTSKVHS